MGINVGICEMEAPSASCRDLKNNIAMVKVENPSDFEDVMNFDMVVSLEDAQNAIPDWERFMKKNRINAETDAIYMEKIKVDDDRAVLEKIAKKVYTGWVNVEGLNASLKEKVIDDSKPENRVNGWDNLSFDEMNEMCFNCPLSWDKGRGCFGAFGPDNSTLPELARKYGCPIIGDVPASAEKKKKFTPEDAMELLKEVEILTAKLPEEGKGIVRRYSGPLERMASVAKISIDDKCGFYFF